MDDEQEDLRDVIALNKLVAEFPDINLQIVHDVLEACKHDFKQAYETICEMVIPPDTLNPTLPQPSIANTTNSHFSMPIQCLPPSSCHSSTTKSTKLLNSSHAPSDIPKQAHPPQLQGAWADQNMTRKLRVDELSIKYQWMSRFTIRQLYDRFYGCMELMEEEILRVFPIDEPQAFGGGQSNPKPQQNQTEFVPSRGEAIAESLRKLDAAEIKRSSIVAGGSSSSTAFQQQRQQLWEKRSLLTKASLLASQTRKEAHRQRAKEIEDAVSKLSVQHLEWIRHSDQYRNGVIDLHGLTKEEAIQLVHWKLVDGGRRRFRVITGRGTHSQNEQSVLRPALEKHFRSKGISFTAYEDGILSVIPR